jgi:hypothetical protein
VDELDRTLRDAARATHRKAAESLDLDAEMTSTLRRDVDSSAFGDLETADRRRVVWLGLMAAAIVVTVAGVALVSSRDDTITTADPNTLPADTDAAVAPSTAAETQPTTTEPPPATTDPTATVPVSSTTVAESTTTIPVPTNAPAAVSYLDPPPELTLRSLGEIAVPLPEVHGASLVVGDLGVAINTGLDGGDDGTDRIVVVGFDGSTRQIDVPSELGWIIAYGPGDVAYMARQVDAIEDFSVVAVPLSGDRAGTVVAEALADINHYVELPPAAFAHGERGIVQRQRDVGATAIEYVDVAGNPTSLAEEAPPFFVADTELQLDSLGGRVESSAGVAWTLAVEAAPDRAHPFDGPSPPAPGSDGVGVYWTHIGPDLQPGQDFGEASMWVIARLAPDGSATWWSIPDGWRVVASDIWGTVLAKQDGQQLQLALAEFAP